MPCLITYEGIVENSGVITGITDDILTKLATSTPVYVQWGTYGVKGTKT